MYYYYYYIIGSGFRNVQRDRRIIVLPAFRGRVLQSFSIAFLLDGYSSKNPHFCCLETYICVLYSYRNSFKFIAKRFHVIPVHAALHNPRTRVLSAHKFHSQRSGMSCTARRTLQFDRKDVISHTFSPAHNEFIMYRMFHHGLTEEITFFPFQHDGIVLNIRFISSD